MTLQPDRSSRYLGVSLGTVRRWSARNCWSCNLDCSCLPCRCTDCSRRARRASHSILTSVRAPARVPARQPHLFAI
jgi:hypothetical protein